MSDITLNMSMCDWLSLVSWEGFHSDNSTPDEAGEKRMQYDGFRRGSVFIGQALQAGFVHSLMQVSGAHSDIFCPVMIEAEPQATSTRIDIQMTVFCHNPNMRALYNRLAERFKTTSFVTSSSGDTIYIGGWKSERFTRIYQKDNRRLLRVEMCWKKGYAEGARRFILENGTQTAVYRETMSRWMKYEILRLDDKELDSLFLPHLNEAQELKAVRYDAKHDSAKEQWLRKVVLKSLREYANSHDASRDLLNEFAVMLDEVIQKGIDNALPIRRDI